MTTNFCHPHSLASANSTREMAVFEAEYPVRAVVKPVSGVGVDGSAAGPKRDDSQDQFANLSARSCYTSGGKQPPFPAR